MTEKIKASARPHKRLFISLITRDIPLADALLDLIDNSVNAALEPISFSLKSADDYQSFLTQEHALQRVQIEVTADTGKISLRDNAAGITTKMAEDHIFQFGRDVKRPHETDRLSVYGIGLKRGMFKCGNKISMVSDHVEGGFRLTLNAELWAGTDEEPWTIPIEARNPVARGKTGTTITITDLHDNVVNRIKDGLFLQQLRDKIAKTYAFFIGRVVDISLNGHSVEQAAFEIGSNNETEKFVSGDVSCNITAGIAASGGETYRDSNAGWFVFCNGRAVLYAEKTNKTGWGAGSLPIFQPKHRPFLGIVFFVSANAEDLPWTTTKSSVNEDSAVWQDAIRRMGRVGKTVIGYLDSRYSDEGTGARPSELKSASGEKMDVFRAATAEYRAFTTPKVSTPKTSRIQYDAARVDIKRIADYLRKPGMGGSEVGRYTFAHFLDNEVGES